MESIANIHNNRVSNRNTIIILIIFIFFPALSFPFLIWQIYNNKKYAFVCLAILFGLWSFLMAPIGDMYRYSMDYYIYENLKFEQFRVMLLLKNDYFLAFLMYTLSILKLPPDLSRFLYVTIGSLIIFFLFYKICQRLIPEEGRNNCFILFIILLLNFKFSSLSFRFVFSCSLYLLGGYYVLVEKKKKGYLLFLLSILNHISFIIFIFPILVVCRLKKFGSKKITLFLLVLIFTFTGTFVNELLLFLAPNSSLIQHALYYTDGVWAGEFLEDHSIGYRVLMMINTIPSIICYFVFYYIFKKNNWSRWIDALLMLVVLTAPYVALKARCQTVTFLPLLFYIIYHIKDIPLKKRKMVLTMLVLSGIIFTGSNLWGSRRELSLSQEYKLFTTNIVEIFNHSYDYNWLRENVNEDGSPAKINY